MDAPRTPTPPRAIPPDARCAPCVPAASSRERIREQLGWRLCQPGRA